MEKVSKILALAIVLMVAVSCKKEKKTTIDFFGNNVKVDNKIQEFKSSPEFLDSHGLKSFSLVTSADNIPQREFEQMLKILSGLLPGHQLDESIFLMQLYLKKNLGPNIPLDKEDLGGFSTMSLGRYGIEHRYFRRDSLGYSNIPKYNLSSERLLSSEESRMLHFGSFGYLPKESTIISFRIEVEEPVDLLANSKKLENKLLDRLNSDGRMNVGALLKDDGPGGAATCGFRCTSNIALSACMGDFSGEIWTCQPVGQGPCLMNETVTLAIENNIEHNADTEKIHAFKNDFLMTNGYANKYVGYYNLFSQYAKYDLTSINQYIDVLPQVYDAVDKVLDNNDHGDEIIIDQDLYNKAIQIIFKHQNIPNQDFQTMLDDVTGDLNTFKNLNKSKIIEYMNSNYFVMTDSNN